MEMNLNEPQEKLPDNIKSLRGVKRRGNPCIVNFSTKLMLKGYFKYMDCHVLPRSACSPRNDGIYDERSSFLFPHPTYSIM